jgi:hypothetical protein
MGNKDHYEVGCLSVLQTNAEDFAVILGGVIIGVACIQVSIQLVMVTLYLPDDKTSDYKNNVKAVF